MVYLLCDQSVNMIFDPKLFIRQLTCLLDSENVYWMIMESTANQIAAYIHAWLEPKYQNQDGVCPSFGGLIKDDLKCFVIFILAPFSPKYV